MNKTNRALEDLKVEVRYLSVTLFDFKDLTATKNKVNNQKFIDIERHFNTSFEELQAENLKNKGEFNEIKEHIHNVEKVQTEYRKTVTGTSFNPQSGKMLVYEENVYGYFLKRKCKKNVNRLHSELTRISMNRLIFEQWITLKVTFLRHILRLK